MLPKYVDIIMVGTFISKQTGELTICENNINVIRMGIKSSGAEGLALFNEQLKLIIPIHFIVTYCNTASVPFNRFISCCFSYSVTHSKVRFYYHPDVLMSFSFQNLCKSYFNILLDYLSNSTKFVPLFQPNCLP